LQFRDLDTNIIWEINPIVGRVTSRIRYPGFTVILDDLRGMSEKHSDMVFIRTEIGGIITEPHFGPVVVTGSDMCHKEIPTLFTLQKER